MSVRVQRSGIISACAGVCSRTWLYNQWPVGATLKESSTHGLIFNLFQASSSLQRKTCCRPGVHVTGTFQLVSPDSHTTNRGVHD